MSWAFPIVHAFDAFQFAYCVTLVDVVSLYDVALPNTLNSLRFVGSLLDQHSFNNFAFPSSLVNLDFDFDQSLANVTLPTGLENLSFGYYFNQSLENVTLPVGLKSLTFGFRFNQSLENVTLPVGLQILTF